MAQPRSTLLRTLIVGLVATLLGAAAYGTFGYFAIGWSFEVRWYWDGLALPVAASVMVGLLVGLTMSSLRSRGFVLPVFAALCACAALALGVVGSLTVRSAVGFFDLYPITGHLIASVEWLGTFLTTSSRAWHMAGIAALLALLLPLARAIRLRRHPLSVQDAPEPEPTPEHRAPFEPAQAPTTRRPPTEILTQGDHRSR